MKKITKLALGLMLMLTICFAFVACSDTKSNPKVESIEITTTKTSYNQRTAFDKDSCTIVATLKGGKTKTLHKNNVEWNIPSFNSYRSGVEVTVTYQGSSDSIFVDVLENAPVELVIVREPILTNQLVGDSLNLDDGQLAVKFADDTLSTSFALPYSINTASMVTGYNPDKPGLQTLLISYVYNDLDGTTFPMTKEISVTLEESTVAELLLEAPTEADYELGEELNLDNYKLQLKYANDLAGAKYPFNDFLGENKLGTGGFSKANAIVQGDSLSISAYDKNDYSNTQTITITYKRTSTASPVTKTFNVTVRKVTGFEFVSTTVQTVYELNEELNLVGEIVKKVYHDGTFGSTIAITEDMIDSSTYDKNATGTQNVKLTIPYDGVDFVTYAEVTVRQVIGIEIIDMPTKLEYKVGEALSLSPCTIRIKYEDGSFSEKFRPDVVTEGITIEHDNVLNVAGEFTVTIEYTAKDGSMHSADFEVTFTEE